MVEPGLAFVVEWADDRPASHVAQGVDLGTCPVQVPAAAPGVCLEKAGIGARGRCRGGIGGDLAEHLLDLARISLIPLVPHRPQCGVGERRPLGTQDVVGQASQSGQSISDVGPGMARQQAGGASRRACHPDRRPRRRPKHP
jgi:hypothetical protein